MVTCVLSSSYLLHFDKANLQHFKLVSCFGGSGGDTRHDILAHTIKSKTNCIIKTPTYKAYFTNNSTSLDNEENLFPKEKQNLPLINGQVGYVPLGGIVICLPTHSWLPKESHRFTGTDHMARYVGWCYIT